MSLTLRLLLHAIAWLALLAAGATPAAAEPSSLRSTKRRASSPTSPWSGAVGLSSTVCLDQSPDAGCAAPGGAAAAGAAASSVQSALAVSLSYAVSRRLSLDLAEALVPSQGALDPTLGPAATVAVARGVVQRSALELSLPASKVSRAQRKQLGAALVTSLDAASGGVMWSVLVRASQSFYPRPETGDDFGTPPQSPSSLVTAASPVDAAPDADESSSTPPPLPDASAATLRELSHYAFGAYAGYAATRRLSLRSGAMVTQLHLDAGLDLWAIDATVCEVTYTRRLASITLGAGLVRTSETLGAPRTPELRLGLAKTFGAPGSTKP